MKKIWDITEDSEPGYFHSSELLKALNESGYFCHRTTIYSYLFTSPNARWDRTHLEKKGYLVRNDKKSASENVYTFQPVISLKEYRKERTKNYLRFFYNGNVSEFLDDLT